ncbi:Uncharacterised protein [Mycobacterium tuberculosis]|nr:Uncharacterised protein [Mycobacterium tuberculosis]
MLNLSRLASRASRWSVCGNAPPNIVTSSASASCALHASTRSRTDASAGSPGVSVTGHTGRRATVTIEWEVILPAGSSAPFRPTLPADDGGDGCIRERWNR